MNTPRNFFAHLSKEDGDSLKASLLSRDHAASGPLFVKAYSGMIGEPVTNEDVASACSHWWDDAASIPLDHPYRQTVTAMFGSYPEHLTPAAEKILKLKVGEPDAATEEVRDGSAPA
jgi:hypothetical protein